MTCLQIRERASFRSKYTYRKVFKLLPDVPTWDLKEVIYKVRKRGSRTVTLKCVFLFEGA